MQVKAAPGIRVPKEHNPRRYITDAQAEDVPRSAYYLRILAEGDLVQVDQVNETATEKTAVVKGSKQ
ncbi:DUF2635 domain-containing protein [Cupriavidus sp. 30B13]|uniref:DUF2635 domain-containing protein n=1 Tax=Cupriavidus sp. 30B13 TaxID=3384241 RepID=UPI003B91606A